MATTGLAALVLVLVVTPDGQAWVLGAWLFVLAGVAAVAFGVALGFRHQDRVERAYAEPRYLTADWVSGAQLLTLDGRSRQAEELGDPVIATGEVPAVDGDGLSGEEGRVA